MSGNTDAAIPGDRGPLPHRGTKAQLESNTIFCASGGRQPLLSHCAWVSSHLYHLLRGTMLPGCDIQDPNTAIIWVCYNSVKCHFALDYMFPLTGFLHPTPSPLLCMHTTLLL